MKQIVPETIEATCEKLTSGTEEDIYASMQQLEEEQAELLTFVLDYIEDLDDHTQGIALYMLVGIYRMFLRTAEEDIRMIPPQKIFESYKYNKKMMAGLENEPSWDFWEATIREETASQPYVVGFVVEEVFPDVDADEWASEYDMEAEEQIYVFLLMKTVIDVLHKGTE